VALRADSDFLMPGTSARSQMYVSTVSNGRTATSDPRGDGEAGRLLSGGRTTRRPLMQHGRQRTSRDDSLDSFTCSSQLKTPYLPDQLAAEAAAARRIDTDDIAGRDGEVDLARCERKRRSRMTCGSPVSLPRSPDFVADHKSKHSSLGDPASAAVGVDAVHVVCPALHESARFVERLPVSAYRNARSPRFSPAARPR
jgi:hypothetical protein